jgi:hypothetical protein
MSELLSVVGDALRVADGEYAVVDLIGSRARSSLARLQVAVLATRILSVLDRRKVLRWLAQESQIAALDEAWCLPAHEREESSPSGPASGGCAVSDRLGSRWVAWRVRPGGFRPEDRWGRIAVRQRPGDPSRGRPPADPFGRPRVGRLRRSHGEGGRCSSAGSQAWLQFTGERRRRFLGFPMTADMRRHEWQRIRNPQIREGEGYG